MTFKETAKLCATIRKATFAWRNESDAEFMETIKIWHECLKEEPFDMAMKATMEYLTANNYPPTIADIYKPYKEYLEERHERNRRLREIYYDTIHHYPCNEDTPEMQNEWMRICGNDISKAERFRQMLVEYVKDHDRKRIDPMPFEEYMKGVKAIE